MEVTRILLSNYLLTGMIPQVDPQTQNITRPSWWKQLRSLPCDIHFFEDESCAALTARGALAIRPDGAAWIIRDPEFLCLGDPPACPAWLVSQFLQECTKTLKPSYWKYLHLLRWRPVRHGLLNVRGRGAFVRWTADGESSAIVYSSRVDTTQLTEAVLRTRAEMNGVRIDGFFLRNLTGEINQYESQVASVVTTTDWKPLCGDQQARHYAVDQGQRDMRPTMALESPEPLVHDAISTMAYVSTLHKRTKQAKLFEMSTFLSTLIHPYSTFHDSFWLVHVPHLISYEIIEEYKWRPIYRIPETLLLGSIIGTCWALPKQKKTSG